LRRGCRLRPCDADRQAGKLKWIADAQPVLLAGLISNPILKNGAWSKRQQAETAKIKTVTPKRRQSQTATE